MILWEHTRAVLLNKASRLVDVQAPIGAERFIDMVSSGALDGTVIYRVVRNEAVQFGFIKDETVSRESQGGSTECTEQMRSYLFQYREYSTAQPGVLPVQVSCWETLHLLNSSCVWSSARPQIRKRFNQMPNLKDDKQIFSSPNFHRGMISFAGAGPNTRGTDVFITFMTGVQ